MFYPNPFSLSGGRFPAAKRVGYRLEIATLMQGIFRVAAASLCLCFFGIKIFPCDSILSLSLSPPTRRPERRNRVHAHAPIVKGLMREKHVRDPPPVLPLLLSTTGLECVAVCVCVCSILLPSSFYPQILLLLLFLISLSRARPAPFCARVRPKARCAKAITVIVMHTKKRKKEEMANKWSQYTIRTTETEEQLFAEKGSIEATTECIRGIIIPGAFLNPVSQEYLYLYCSRFRACALHTAPFSFFFLL